MSLKPKKGLDGINKRRLVNKRAYPVRWDSKFEIPALRTLLLGRDFFLRVLSSNSYLSVRMKLSVATANFQGIQSP